MGCASILRRYLQLLAFNDCCAGTTEWIQGIIHPRIVKRENGDISLLPPLIKESTKFFGGVSTDLVSSQIALKSVGTAKKFILLE